MKTVDERVITHEGPRQGSPQSGEPVVGRPGLLPRASEVSISSPLAHELPKMNSSIAAGVRAVVARKGGR
jgi:hypothetical protein